MRKLLARGLAFAGLCAPTIAHAASAITSQPNGADTVWILISSALVLMMCMPGLGLFYGGLVRAKNFLSVLVQVGAIAAANSEASTVRTHSSPSLAARCKIRT